jgi:hypothetical protein
MKSQDPVLDALANLSDTTPESLKPLLEAYESGGVDGIETAWTDLIKETLSED